MNNACITTFSRDNWEQYAKKFLDSYLENWPLPIWIYWEGDDFPIEHEKIHWVNLNDDPDRQRFLFRHGSMTSKDYRFNAVKFCHKVFALTDPNRLGKADGWIWLDADIVTEREVDDDFLGSVCPAGFTGSYLGRSDWHHSECGWMWFNMTEGAGAVLEGMRQVYTSETLFRLAEWHDSFVFDTVRRGWWFNLSDGVPGMHVFDDCILGAKMSHAKGELRKAGGNIQGMPKGYSSNKEAGKSVARMGDGVPLLVKTRNCVPDDRIQGNIRFSATRLDRGKYIRECVQDFDAMAILVSAGPSLDEYLDKIAEMAKKPHHYVIAVKHAVHKLRERNIPVFACVLLDPREHVADFIDVEDKDTLYIVASMCDPAVINTLRDNDLNYRIYHAHVGAGENKVIREQLGDDHIMISGGCSTAMRTIPVMRTLGFRRFRLFGYDLCYATPDEKSDNRFNPRYETVTIEGREFHTDAEKIAQAQDFKNMMLSMPDVELEAFGPGIIPHIWNATRAVLPHFEDILSG